MGACNTTTGRDAATIEIEKTLKIDRKASESEVKILLLGTGGSGKSTISKQFKIINEGDYSEDERLQYKRLMFDNLFSSMIRLVEAADRNSWPLTEQNLERAERIRNLNPTTAVLQDFREDILEVWNDPAIQEAYTNSTSFQLNDNTKYLLDSMERMCSPGFIPTQDDVLRVRSQTLGVSETTFKISDSLVRLIDVGGQRTQRRKWIQCFDCVTAVLYCAALSDFDLVLEEDGKTNRLKESLAVFDKTINMWFPETPIVLFLNKKDLLKEKMKEENVEARKKFKECFPEFDGIEEYKPVGKFICQKFVDLDNNKSKKRLFPHFTCATDTKAFRRVSSDVKKTILDESLACSGLPT